VRVIVDLSLLPGANGALAGESGPRATIARVLGRPKRALSHGLYLGPPARWEASV
jgi:hypothetical protein